MQFYRRLSAFKAISFDLDDTLYNNRPIMLAIEKKMINYFDTLLVASKTDPNTIFNSDYWAPYRHTIIQQYPDITHDVVALRYESYRLGLLALNFEIGQAEKQAKLALDYFIKLRSDFSVPEASLKLLAQLSAQFPLVSISNGNVDTKALGIEHYFTHIYHAGYQALEGYEQHKQQGELLKQKPEADMFDRVCQQLNILPSELLHVGDCGLADIHGALQAGCQTAWLPHYGVGKSLKQLPQIELKDVCELERLLKF
jgi:putative hydrolase of the HAD superfamily